MTEAELWDATCKLIRERTKKKGPLPRGNAAEAERKLKTPLL